MVKFNIASIDLWTDVAGAAGAAPEEVEQARVMALGQFAPDSAEAAQATGNA